MEFQLHEPLILATILRPPLPVCTIMEYMLLIDCDDLTCDFSMFHSVHTMQVWNHRLHKQKIQHSEFVPSAPHLLLTASNDRTIRLWDLRQVKESCPTPVITYDTPATANSGWCVCACVRACLLRACMRACVMQPHSQSTHVYSQQSNLFVHTHCFHVTCLISFSLL